MENISKEQFVESMKIFRDIFDKNFRLGTLPYSVWTAKTNPTPDVMIRNQARVDMNAFEAFMDSVVENYDEYANINA